ncbi:MAG TPA: DNA polymerase III subunit delta [Pseudonocardiaceae bacterium]|jgi:DNA polymerase-3 subunit delta|nr:DNA polymerase III subunit delta [Pseudonocardiaceae bacterium]
MCGVNSLPVTSAPLHLILGEEELLVERAVQAVVAAARQADPQTEVSRVRTTDLVPGELDELVSPSLFAPRRVVVLGAAHEAGKDIADAVLDHARHLSEGAGDAGDIVLVVVHAGGARGKALLDALRAAGAAVVECPRVTRFEDRVGFVRNEVHRAGGRISAGAVTALLDAVGSELRELASAAAQLTTDSGGSVDEAAVRRYHRGRAEVTGFSVAEKVMTGDHAGALELLRWAMQLGVPHVLVADALADAVRTVARVSASGGADPYRLASTLGMPPWKVKKAMAQARGWERDGLAQAIQLVATLNADVKGVAADADYALESAVLALCAARRR